MKYCPKCGIFKNDEGFSRRLTSPDGLYSYCKACKAQDDKEYASRNKDKIKARKKLWVENNKIKVDKWFREHRLKNKKKIKKYQEKYRTDNRTELKEKKHRYYLENKERLRLRMKAWRDNNPERMRLIRGRRRAAVKNADGEITVTQINNLIKDSGNVCFWCDCNIPNGKMHLDHIYPLSKNGGHTISNLCVSCSDCNLRKNDKDPEVWLDEILEGKIKV